MADRLNDERAAFEAWAISEGWTERNLRRDPTSGCYLDGGVAAIWLGWAARATRASGVPECFPLLDPNVPEMGSRYPDKGCYRPGCPIHGGPQEGGK